MDSRLTFIDTAKCLAIFAVILGHTEIWDTMVCKLLFAFHVQLFFIAYGFVFGIKNLPTPCCHDRVLKLKKLIRRVIVPYLLLSFILGRAFDTVSCMGVVYGSIFSLRGVSSLHLWYLPCYALASFVHYCIETLRKNNIWGAVFAAFLFAVIAYLLEYESNIQITIFGKTLHLTGHHAEKGAIGLPWSFNVACSGIVLIYIGQLLRFLYNKIQNRINKTNLILFSIISGGLGLISFFANTNALDSYWNRVVLPYGEYGNYLLFLFASVLLSVMIICISALFDNKFLSSIGKNTLAIYAIHPLITGVTSLIMIKCLEFFTIEIVEINTILYNVLISLITLLVCYMCVPVMKKYVPNVIGE